MTCSSRVTPKYLEDSLLVILVFSNLILSGKFFVGFLLDLKTIKFDFLELRVNLFALNHAFNCVIICVPLEVISSLVLHLKKIVVSSAKIRKLPMLHALKRSFMYNINSKGPRTDPWATP